MYCVREILRCCGIQDEASMHCSKHDSFSPCCTCRPPPLRMRHHTMLCCYHRLPQQGAPSCPARILSMPCIPLHSIEAQSRPYIITHLNPTHALPPVYTDCTSWWQQSILLSGSAALSRSNTLVGDQVNAIITGQFAAC